MKILCDQCCKDVHRTISMLEGKCVNLMAYGCDGGECDRELRSRLDKWYENAVQKKREERNQILDNPAPQDVPREGSLEIQLLAIQKELSFFKAYYIEIHEKLNKINSLVGNLEHLELFTKVTKLFDDWLESRF